MQRRSTTLTGYERTFGDDEIIVSKTDLKGVITYANHVFLRVSGYSEQELLGQPHNIIRHPAMPRCVFKLLWDVIADGREIFAYVINRCKNGDHYWVLAHVTPTFDSSGRIIGYHSSRRKPSRSAVEQIEELYRRLSAEEQSHANWREGMESAGRLLAEQLQRAGVSYDEFVFSLATETSTC